MDGNKQILSGCSSDRKAIEKNRRNQMKSLYDELSSLVPRYAAKADAGTILDKVDEATDHIKKLQKSVKKLKLKKEKLQGQCNQRTNGEDDQVRLLEPELEVHKMGSALEVILITGLDQKFTLFSEVVRVLHEEGVEVVNASFYVASDKVFHIIHSKVEEDATGYNGGSRIEERLHDLLH